MSPPSVARSCGQGGPGALVQLLGHVVEGGPGALVVAVRWVVSSGGPLYPRGGRSCRSGGEGPCRVVPVSCSVMWSGWAGGVGGCLSVGGFHRRTVGDWRQNRGHAPRACTPPTPRSRARRGTGARTRQDPAPRRRQPAPRRGTRTPARATSTRTPPEATRTRQDRTTPGPGNKTARPVASHGTMGTMLLARGRAMCRATSPPPPPARGRSPRSRGCSPRPSPMTSRPRHLLPRRAPPAGPYRHRLERAQGTRTARRGPQPHRRATRTPP